MKYGYLIDMDGVIYRSNELIPGADTFINRLVNDNIPFRFLTNNSQRTRRDMITKLNRMGFHVGEEHIYTCAMATARYLAHQKPNGTAFVIGEGGLLNALHRNGYAIVDHDPDYVVVGEGRTMNFEVIEAAVDVLPLSPAEFALAAGEGPRFSETAHDGELVHYTALRGHDGLLAIGACRKARFVLFDPNPAYCAAVWEGSALVPPGVRCAPIGNLDYTIGIESENEAERRDGNALEIARLQGSKKRRFIKTC